MPTQQRLTGGPGAVEIAPGGYRLQAPGVRGSVTRLSAAEQASRSDAGVREDRLQAALAGAEIRQPVVFELAIEDDGGRERAGTARSDGATRRTREGEPAIALRVPRIAPNVGQAVLYTDEAGVSRWIYPTGVPSTAGGTSRGGDDGVLFLLPRPSAPVPPAVGDTSRGPISRLGRRLVRVLTWVTDDIVGRGALAVATRWEGQHRPYGLRRPPFSSPAGPPPWDELRRGRALLFLHGTFSSTPGAFGALPAATVAQLGQLYGDRLLGFDHPSLHRSPQENAQELLDRLPDRCELELDVVTHSRGGLLGRELIERLADLRHGGRAIRVRRAILVAVPNNGTILTDGDHGIAMLDRYTNLLTALPDDAFTLTMEGLLLVAKLLLHGTLEGLPGLSAMCPGGDYLRRLNASPAHDTRYYALAANFTPSAPGLLARFGRMAANRFIDSIFGEDNDGVVPTRGSYELNPAGTGFSIPAERRVVLEGMEQIHHCNYFANERVNRQIIEWLAG